MTLAAGTRQPWLSPLLPKGKEWVHLVDHDSAPQTFTPSELADFLSQADGVKKLDAGEIDAKLVERYQGTVDVRDLAEKTGRESLPPRPDAIGPGGLRRQRACRWLSVRVRIGHGPRSVLQWVREFVGGRGRCQRCAASRGARPPDGPRCCRHPFTLAFTSTEADLSTSVETRHIVHEHTPLATS
jgi:hypothetical protein